MSKAGAVEREQVSYSSRGADESGKGNNVEVRFRISAASDAYSGLSIVGNTAELGEWDVSKSVRLKAVRDEQGADKDTDVLKNE